MYNLKGVVKMERLTKNNILLCNPELADKLLCKIKDNQLREFVYELIQDGFLNECSEEEISEAASEYGICWLRFRHNGITIQIRESNYSFLQKCEGELNYLVGIDPTSCYDSLQRSSILAQFPMSKREYKRFRNLFSKVLDKKNGLFKDWELEANGCFYGEYATFL